MLRSTTLIVPAGLLGLLLVTTQLQAEPAAKSADGMAQESQKQLSDDRDSPPQQMNSDNSMDSSQQRDAIAREKAKEIILQMEKKLGTQ